MSRELTDRQMAAYASLVQKLASPPEGPQLTDRQRAYYAELVDKLVLQSDRGPSAGTGKPSMRDFDYS